MIKRQYDNNFNIDGNPILAPDNGISVTISDLDSNDSGYDEAGFFHRIVVRHSMHKWSFSYSVLTEDEYKYIKNLFNGKDSFTVACTDRDGKTDVTNAYCKESSISYFSRRLSLYKNLKFDIIEA